MVNIASMLTWLQYFIQLFSPQDVLPFPAFISMFGYISYIIHLFQSLSQSAALTESMHYFELNNVNISSLDLVSSGRCQCLLGGAIKTA